MNRSKTAREARIAKAQELRDQRKMGVTEIARELGVSRHTIYNYIGPENPSLRKKSEGCLHVKPSAVTLQGELGEYDVTPNTKKIDIFIESDESGIEGRLPFADLDLFIRELQAIQRGLNTYKPQREVW